MMIVLAGIGGGAVLCLLLVILSEIIYHVSEGVKDFRYRRAIARNNDIIEAERKEREMVLTQKELQVIFKKAKNNTNKGVE